MKTLSILSALVLFSAAAKAQTFTDVKLVPQLSEALAVSEDGSTILGNSVGPNAAPGIYTVASTAFAPFNASGGAAYFLSGGVSGDGLVAVGAQGLQTFAWTPAMVYDMTPVFGFDCNDVSTSGLVLAGSYSLGGVLRSRWIELTTGTVVELGALTPTGGSKTEGLSGNGRYVVGATTDPANGFADLPFRFDVLTQSYQLLSPMGSGNGTARDVSANGSVVVGTMNGEAFAWTASGGLQLLGFLQGSVASHAHGVSKDGRWVVGQCEFGGGVSRAFVLDLQSPGSSMKDMTQLLAAGLPSGTVLTAAYDVDLDGNVVVGLALAANGAAIGFHTL
ncbi:MAG: hypothetical protein IT454_02650 [Planctomycetes bacterium]|nr:hypothetical protein [Planctomycetota bacterium]